MTPAAPPAPANKFQAWYRAARPRTLTATYVPLAAAALIALDQGVFEPVRFVLSLIGALFLQVAANLINEYVDFRRGAEDRKVAGQGMILKHALLTPREVLIGAIVTVAVGVLIGMLLLAVSGPVLFWIGLGGVVIVITYTAGPFPLAYNALGEAAVFIFMGPLMVLGAYYVMAVEVSWLPVLVGLPIGAMCAAILHANNIRDRESDRAVNKRTLALLLGLRGARAEYLLLVGGAYIGVVALVVSGVVPVLSLLVFVTLPEAVRLIRIVYETDDPQRLHAVQGRTAKLHGSFGLWWLGGWALFRAAAGVLVFVAG
jgi:1,4-dihydroxy-2-naphthoate octaprenyltransferase